MFVALTLAKETSGEFIQSVRYILDETFKPGAVKLYDPPFILSRLGWGEFTIGIEIEFKKWTGQPKMKLEHDLIFEEKGSSKAFIIEIENEIIQKNISKELLDKMGQLTTDK